MPNRQVSASASVLRHISQIGSRGVRLFDVASERHVRCLLVNDQGSADVAPHALTAQCHAYGRVRISGPLIDRIDIHIEVPAVTLGDLSRAQHCERSSDIRKRVERARAKMVERQEKADSKLTSSQIERYCSLGTGAAAILQSAITKLGLSARGYHRILKVARTIADLIGADEITAVHVAEAVQNRRLDRQ